MKRSVHHHQKIAAFIGTGVPQDEMEALTDAHNTKYFEQWSDLLRNSASKSYYRYIARKYDCSFAKRGYSLMRDFGTNREVLSIAGSMSNTLGALSCLIVDARWKMERQVRAILPFTIKNLIRRVMGKEPKTLVVATIAVTLDQIMSLGLCEAIT